MVPVSASATPSVPASRCYSNAALQALRNDQLSLGFGLSQLRGAVAPHMARAAGYHWLSVDAEHGGFSLAEISQVCAAALAVGIAPIVRVRAEALDEGARALDNGAQGIIVPNVNTATDAHRLVEAMRYAPQGRRNWGPSGVQFGFDVPSFEQAKAEMDAQLLLVAMLETPEGIANAQAIAAVPGVDVVFVGAVDLSSELGISGQFGHPRLQEAFTTAAEACRQQGKYLGMGGVYDEVWARRYMALGARFIAGGSDQAFVMASARSRSAFLQACHTQTS